MNRKDIAEWIAKGVVIALIAVFLGLTFAERKGKSAGAAGFPGGMPGGAAGFAGFGGSGGRQQAANTVTVSAKAAEPELIQETVRVSGDISSKTEVNAYPIAAGKVTQVLKTIGDTVKKGETIAYVDPSRPGSSYAASPVTAPIAGTIVASTANLGDTISTNTAIATIGSVTDLVVTVHVAEKYSAYLKVGLPCYISVASAPGEVFDAKITAISPVVNKTNRTVEVALAFNKYDKRIKPGMYASVNLVIRESASGFVVPRTALHDYNGKDSIYIIDENNCAKRVMVTTGISTDTEIEITGGVNKGDTLITAGSVTEGTPVRIAGTAVEQDTAGAPSPSTGAGNGAPPTGAGNSAGAPGNAPAGASAGGRR